ncbi:MAG: alpha/beta fold hydrolase [Pseudomonadota bacterium]
MAALLASLLTGCGPQFVDHGSDVRSAGLTDTAYVAADGVRLPAQRYAPEGEPRAIVLALHSFGDFGLAFEQVGPALAARGFAVVAPDQRGFGQSPAFGRWWGHDVMVADAVTLAGLLRDEFGDLPVILLGESMGGAVAMLAATPAGADAVILAAPAVRAELPHRWAWDVGFRTAATVVPWYTREVDHGEATLTEVARDRLADDPRVLREVRADTYWGLLRLANAASALPAGRLPRTLLLFGDEDSVVPDVSLCELASRLGNDSASWVYPGGGHRLMQEPAGLATLDSMVAWIEDPSAAAPSEAHTRVEAYCPG